MLTSRRVYLLSSFQVVKCTQYYSFSYINKSFCFQTYMSNPSENFLTSVPSLTAPLYIPTNTVGVLQFFYTLTSSCYGLLLDSSHPSGCEVVS